MILGGPGRSLMLVSDCAKVKADIVYTHAFGDVPLVPGDVLKCWPGGTGCAPIITGAEFFLCSRSFAPGARSWYEERGLISCEVLAIWPVDSCACGA